MRYSSMVERLPLKQDAVGSSPTIATWVGRLIGIGLRVVAPNNVCSSHTPPSSI